MKKTTRLLSLLLVLLLCMSLLPMAAMADGSETAEADETIIMEDTPENAAAEEIPAEEPAAETSPIEEADQESSETITEVTAEEVPEETAPEADIEIVEAEPEEAPASEDDTLISIDGVYGDVISSSSDSRIATMLALIDNQNFTGSGITSAQAKQYVQHFLYTSNFKAIGHGVYTYPNSGNYTTTVSDGTYTRAISGSKGCMSYCRFVSKVFYNTEGTLSYSTIQTASSLKSMLQKYGQAGDHIRMGERHSVTFISCDDNGFYCLSYQGDSTRYIYLEYWTYANFVAYYTGLRIGIYDANKAENATSGGGSESSETGESTLTISNPVYPSDTITYGAGFSLGGTITSNYTLTNVTASVCNTSGTAVLTYSTNPGTKSYNIAGSDLDSAIKFGSLARGNYTYILTATDSTGKTLTLVTSPFICGSSTTYTVTYDANGGTGAPAAQTKTHDVTLKLSTVIPTLAGQNFLGWATSSTTDTADYKAGDVYTENKSITLYAVWSGAGLRYENGKLYYYDNNNKKATGIVIVDDKTYYFDPNNGGAAYQSQWRYVDNEGWYYFSANGAMATDGVHVIDGSHFYFDDDGLMVSGGWFERDNKTYYADRSGYLTCGLAEINNEKYYFNDDCVLTTGWVYLDAGWSYFDESNKTDESGDSNYARIVYGWKEIGGSIYYFDETGLMHTGWLEVDEEGQIVDVYKFYFAPDGKLVTGWYCIDGSWYFFNDSDEAITGLMDFSDWREGFRYLDSTGKMAVGIQCVDRDYYYFSDTESTPAEGLGEMTTGWICLNNSWYYFNPNRYTGTQEITDSNGNIQTCTFDRTGRLSKGVYEINGKLYLINSNYEIQTAGWYQDNSSSPWYYVNSDGTLTTGWLWYGGTYYYMLDDGIMAANTTVNYGNAVYGFDSSGKMLNSGWAAINGNTYYFQSSGAAIQNNWLWYGNSYYYLLSDGTMAANTTVTYGNNVYGFDSSGKMLTSGWKTIDGSTYYFQSSGTAIRNNWLWYNNNYYYFGSDGKMYSEQWLWYSGSFYWFSKDGTMVTGTVVNYGNFSYGFDAYGRMITNGWLSYNGNYYFFGSDGSMSRSQWVWWGAYYYILQDGTMAADTTVEIGDYTYYFYSSGIMASNVTINGVTYAEDGHAVI